MHLNYTMAAHCNNLLLIPIYSANKRPSVTQYQFEQEVNHQKNHISLFLIPFYYLARLVLYVRHNNNK